MTQTSEIFLVGYSGSECGPEARATAENAHQYFLDLSGVELINPIVLYSPEPAAEAIAHSVVDALPSDLATTLAPSPTILEHGEHPGHIQRLDYWMGPKLTKQLTDWEASTAIVITRAPLVRHLTQDAYDWLFKDTPALDDVVRCELLPPDLPRDQFPDTAIALSGEHLLKLAPDVPILPREKSRIKTEESFRSVTLFSSAAS